jgi:hypothetical protein
MSLCLENRSLQTWDEIIQWCSTELRKECFKTRLKILCLGAALYILWRQGNALLHSKNIATEEALLSKIKWDVKTRILEKGMFKRTKENLRLVKLWNISFI